MGGKITNEIFLISRLLVFDMDRPLSEQNLFLSKRMILPTFYTHSHYRENKWRLAPDSQDFLLRNTTWSHESALRVHYEFIYNFKSNSSKIMIWNLCYAIHINFTTSFFFIFNKILRDFRRKNLRQIFKTYFESWFGKA